MSSNELISTVITSYNKGDFLAEAIESALCQKNVQQEIIVVNDGSTDATAEVMQQYRKHIKALHQDNLGQAVARNRSIRESRGEYIAFLDGDDCWMDSKLEKQMNVFRQDKEISLVYSKRTIIKNNLDDRMSDQKQDHKRNVVLFRGYVLDDIIINNCIPFSSAVAKKKTLEQVGLFDESLRVADDYDLWLRLSKDHRIDYVDEELIKYRVCDNSIGGRVGNKSTICLDILDRFIKKYYNGKYPRPSVIRLAISEKYNLLGDYHLAGSRHLNAFAAYSRSAQYDTFNWRRYYSIIRSFVPISVVSRLRSFMSCG